MQCLRPEYNAYLDIQQEERIIELVQRLFTAWTSDKFSLDERHNTQLYAQFLKQLMEPHIARLAMKKRAASVFGRDAASPAPHAAPGASAHEAGSGPASAPTPAGSDVSSSTAAFYVKAEHPPVSPTAHSGSSGSASSSPVFPHHIPAAAASLNMHIEDLYATDVDIAKEASQLAAAAGMTIPPDMNMENMSWEQLLSAGASLGGGLGDALGGMMGGMLGAAPGSGPGVGPTDWNGMTGDECLAAMMGLGDNTWFLSSNPGGS